MVSGGHAKLPHLASVRQEENIFKCIYLLWGICCFINVGLNTERYQNKEVLYVS